MKKILLISYNFYPELTGIGKYNGEMIDWFVKHGYDCSVLTGYPYYPDWKVDKEYSEKKHSFSTEHSGKNERLTVYRCPMYIPVNPSALKRILLEVSFFVSAFLRLITLLVVHKYDLVITVAPSFHVGLLGVLCKKLHNTAFLYHIQDMQIEAARDLKMVTSNRIINAMLFVERNILNNATLVSSISDRMVANVKSKTKTNVALFPNWTNTNFFYPIEDKQFLKEEYGFKKTDRIVLYSGAMGEKQGLESILQCALVNKSDVNLKFIICGNGPYKEKLKLQAQNLGLDNVLFYALQPLSTFNRFLNLADVHLIIQRACASDLVMPSKLGAILAVGGCCVVTSNPGTSLHALIQKYKMGYLVEADNQVALENGLSVALINELNHVQQNARKYAEEFLSIDKVMQKLENTFCEDISSKTLRPLETTLEPMEV